MELYPWECPDNSFPWWCWNTLGVSDQWERRQWGIASCWKLYITWKTAFPSHSAAVMVDCYQRKCLCTGLSVNEMNKQMPLRVGDFIILAQYLFCGDKMKLTFLLASCAVELMISLVYAVWSHWSVKDSSFFKKYLFSCAGSSVAGMQSLSCGMWDLVPWSGIKARPPSLGTQNLSCWTTREVPPNPSSFIYLISPLRYFPLLNPQWLFNAFNLHSFVCVLGKKHF